MKQLLGLQALGKDLDKQLDQIIKAVSKILGEDLEEDDLYRGHSSDIVIGGETVLEVLRKLGVEMIVEDT